MFKAASGDFGCSQRYMWKVMTGNCTQREKDQTLAAFEAVWISCLKERTKLCIFNNTTDHFPKIAITRTICHLPGTHRLEHARDSTRFPITPNTQTHSSQDDFYSVHQKFWGFSMRSKTKLHLNLARHPF